MAIVVYDSSASFIPQSQSQSPCDIHLFSFGVIADIQFADVDNGFSFSGDERHYRRALEVSARAAYFWTNQMTMHGAGGLRQCLPGHPMQPRHAPQFAVHLGDIVDGVNEREAAPAALDSVLSALRPFSSSLPLYHVIGNHCLYKLSRPQLEAKIPFPSRSFPDLAEADNPSYYDFEPQPQWRCIVLDAFNVSTLAWDPKHPKFLQAQQILEDRNPNTNKNSPLLPDGSNTRFVQWNGGLGERQIKWMDAVLDDANSKKQRVIIFCHVPVFPNHREHVLIWDYEEALSVMRRHSVVQAVFSGHQHEAAHGRDESGIHHVVFESVIECPVALDSYGTVHVYHDRIEVEGVGHLSSYVLPLTQ